MKKSEVIEELVKSYYFQYGKNSDTKVTRGAEKIIRALKKREEKEK